jgi:hypothetical protein
MHNRALAGLPLIHILPADRTPALLHAGLAEPDLQHTVTIFITPVEAIESATNKNSSFLIAILATAVGHLSATRCVCSTYFQAWQAMQVASPGSS